MVDRKDFIQPGDPIRVHGACKEPFGKKIIWTNSGSLFS